MASWRHVAIYTPGSTLAQANVLLPEGTKHLPETMLTNRENCSVASTWEQFHKNVIENMCPEIIILLKKCCNVPNELSTEEHVKTCLIWIIMIRGKSHKFKSNNSRQWTLHLRMFETSQCYLYWINSCWLWTVVNSEIIQKYKSVVKSTGHCLTKRCNMIIWYPVAPFTNMV